MQGGDFQERLGNADEDQKVLGQDKRDGVGVAPASLSVHAVAGQKTHGEHNGRHDANTDGGRKAVKRKKKAGQGRHKGGDQKPADEPPGIVPAKHRRHDRQADKEGDDAHGGVEGGE